VSPLPWFPFYVDDFLASPKVRRMDAEDVGVYLLLLLEQWQQGPIPEGSEDELADVMRTQCERIANVLRNCFEKTPKGWVNNRLLRIEKEQLAKSASARRAAKARWGKASDADALRTQSERNAIQNQNQNQNQVTDKPKPKKRKSQVPDDYTPTDAHRTYATKHGLDLDREVPAFVDYHRAKGTTFLDHDRAFSTWLRKAVEFGRGKPSTNGTDPPDIPGMSDEEWAADIARRRRELEERHAT
jgi:uncharacterized protein YdaU (DUF1376 family)